MTIAIICITVAFVLLLVQILHMKETIKYYDSKVKSLILEKTFNNVINKRVFDDIKNGTYDINDFYFDEINNIISLQTPSIDFLEVKAAFIDKIRTGTIHPDKLYYDTQLGVFRLKDDDVELEKTNE